MCTATWGAAGERLQLCFNRDEQKARPVAEAPRVFTSGNGVRYVASIDPQGGGTWLAANEYGLCCFLLNNYEVDTRSEGGGRSYVSRGELPVALVAQSDGDAAAETLLNGVWQAYRPFKIGLATPRAVRLFAWDGCRLAEEEGGAGICTTSSARSAAVQGYRRSLYESLVVSQGTLSLEARRRYHTDRVHQDPAFNAMMLRDDARTQSLTTVTVDADQVRLSYEATLSDSLELSAPSVVELPRRDSL